MLIVRELSAGLYYGRKGRFSDGTVFDTCEYHPEQSSGSRALPSSSRGGGTGG